MQRTATKYQYEVLDPVVETKVNFNSRSQALQFAASLSRQAREKITVNEYEVESGDQTDRYFTVNGNGKITTVRT